MEKVTPPDPASCPLCNEPNRCGLLEGGGRCWCFEIAIPPSLLEQIPEESRGVACLCRACVETEHHSQAATGDR